MTRKLLLALLIFLPTLAASALKLDVANSDGVTIVYDKLSASTLAVTFKGDDYERPPATGFYTGTVNIPQSINKNGVIYSVVAIGDHAFYKSSVTAVNLPATLNAIGTESFYYCQGLTSMNIPEGTTTIGSKAFASCVNLISIEIPSTITSIGANAFDYCNKISSFTILVEDPTTINIGENLFGTNPSIYQSAILFVPKSSVEIYRHTLPWSNFIDIVGVGDFDGNIIDGEAYINGEALECQNVTYVRKFLDTTWEPLYIPFDMSYEEWSPYADVAEVYNVRGYDNNSDGEIDDIIIEFNLLTSGKVRPNTPYVVRAKQPDDVTIECIGKTVAAAPGQNGSVVCGSTRNTFTFTGVYLSEQLPSDGCHYILTGNTFEKVTTETPVKPNGIYMQIGSKAGGYNPSATAPLHIYMSVIGAEDSTSIRETAEDGGGNAVIYDLSGRRVNNPDRGIFITPAGKILK